ncbi:MAG: hypothetical protein QOJ72_2400 [Nocardioidaceae bacterium]|jgi:hypothetical protein|nr:hypothetical protein [Nocardioidaceae bacterium]
MYRMNGQSPADDGPPVPTTVDLGRACDFCGTAPTTHWLTFTPAAPGAGWTLPAYLGSCAVCADTIDFSNAGQLATIGNQPPDVADVLARHFLTITPGA